MRKLQNLNDQRGETLLETLAAILIVVLSAVMLLTGVTAGSRLNLAADRALEEQNTALVQAERQEGEGLPAEVVLTFEDRTKTAPVSIYGGEDYASYRRAGAGE